MIMKTCIGYMSCLTDSNLEEFYQFFTLGSLMGFFHTYIRFLAYGETISIIYVHIHLIKHQLIIL